MTISETLAAADRAFGTGRSDEGERLCHSILDLEPNNVTALFLLGRNDVKAGRFESAVDRLRMVSDSTPLSGSGPLWLSRALLRMGCLTEALTAAQDSVRRAPGDWNGWVQLGHCLLDAGRPDEAVEAFQKGRQLNPPDRAPALYFGLGRALHGLGRLNEASQALKHALACGAPALPTKAALWQVAVDAGWIEEVVGYAQSLWQVDPSASSMARLAASYLLDNRPEEAERALRQAIEMGLPASELSSLLGSILIVQGRIEEAEAELEAAIEQRSSQGAVYASYAYLRRMTPSDAPALSQMRVVRQDGKLLPDQASLLEYALGKASEDLGEYSQAMEHFDLANRLALQAMFGGRRFDRATYEAQVNAAIDHFGPEFLSQVPASDSDLPIFVVGMLRSGTTLVDQILSSHPEIGSAGEQRFWLQRLSDSFDVSKLRALEEMYVRRLSQVAPGCRRVVDKMPDNYLQLPLIGAAFPKGKIIHIMRDPFDTCVSVYTTVNRLRIDWCHDKGDIAFVYRQYRRLMDLWQSQLPMGSVLEVRYEDLISDPERVSRQMLDHCGLSWDDACLAPERNSRPVLTPSATQVRRPIYSTSVGRWKRYEPWLADFGDLAG